MPIFPKSLSSPFRHSYASSTPPSSLKPRPRPQSRWTCLSPFRRRRRQHLPDPYPDAPQPHYFDSYTGTWSPRKVPITPAGRSGIWSPRAIASRLGTPARRPATPAAVVPVVVVNGPTTVTATTTIPEEKQEEEEQAVAEGETEEKRKRRRWMATSWNSLRQDPRTPPPPPTSSTTAVAASPSRPPSRGKQHLPLQPNQLNQQTQHHEHKQPHPQQQHTQFRSSSYPFPSSPPSSSSTPPNPADDANWVVMRVPLLARGDGRPRSRDFAFIEDVIEEAGEEAEDEGIGREKERDGGRMMGVHDGAGIVPVPVPVLKRVAVV